MIHKENLTESQAGILEMLDSPLAKVMTWTRFPDVFAKRKTTVEGGLLDLWREMREVDEPAKAGVPLLKLGTFGLVPKVEKGCLRHDANVQRAAGARRSGEDRSHLSAGAAVGVRRGDLPRFARRRAGSEAGKLSVG